MKRFIATISLLAPLGFAGCGTGLLDPILYDYWDPVCGCYLPYYLEAVPPLLVEDFAEGARPDLWLTSGSVEVDALEGVQAPSIAIAAGRGSLTSRETFPLEEGLVIEVAARFRALAAQPGLATVEVREALTGSVVASVEVEVAPDGSAAVTYAIIDPTGQAVEATEWVSPEAAGAEFRLLRLSVVPGAVTWSVDGETQLAFTGAPPAARVTLTLSASSADVRFDSVFASLGR